MSAENPSDTASDTTSPGSSSECDYGLPSSPQFQALVFSVDGGLRKELFKFFKDKPIVQSQSHSEPRPDSRLHQWDTATCEELSILHMSNHHLLYMAPEEGDGLFPNPWTNGSTSGNMYLLKVKEPHGLLAYENISVPPPSKQKQFRAEIAAELKTARDAKMEAASALTTMIRVLQQL